MENHSTFASLTIAYLDSMPPWSKVNFPDLIDVVMQRFEVAVSEENHHLGTQHLSASAWTRRDRAYVDLVVHQVVQARSDLTVERGRGICKNGERSPLITKDHH
jgi:hypothetical protein